jgi:hypothetical protein
MDHRQVATGYTCGLGETSHFSFTAMHNPNYQEIFPGTLEPVCISSQIVDAMAPYHPGY